VIRWLSGRFFGLASRVEVVGTEHIPSRGGLVLVFNHLSNFDAHLIFSRLPRRDVTGLVAAVYRDRPIESFLVEAAGGLWLRRGVGDRAALRNALSLLAQGWIVGIAPEGARTKTGGLAEAKRGAAWLARRSGVPVLPVAVTGTERISSSLLRLERPVVTLSFDRPFPLRWAHRQAPGKVQLRDATTEMMSQLASQLPPSYRGVYGADTTQREEHGPSGIDGGGRAEMAPSPLTTTLGGG
jgi:1-acyl-sn-glycerol-3-phosphate acyltransferase